LADFFAGAFAAGFLAGAFFADFVAFFATAFLAGTGFFAVAFLADLGAFFAEAFLAGAFLADLATGFFAAGMFTLQLWKF
jgi:hypothetical protein